MIENGLRQFFRAHNFLIARYAFHSVLCEKRETDYIYIYIHILRTGQKYRKYAFSDISERPRYDEIFDINYC